MFSSLWRFKELLESDLHPQSERIKRLEWRLRSSRSLQNLGIQPSGVRCLGWILRSWKKIRGRCFCRWKHEKILAHNICIYIYSHWGNTLGQTPVFFFAYFSVHVFLSRFVWGWNHDSTSWLAKSHLRGKFCAPTFSVLDDFADD